MIFGMAIELEAISRTPPKIGPIRNSPRTFAYESEQRIFVMGYTDRTRATYGSTMNRHGLEPLPTAYLYRFQPTNRPTFEFHSSTMLRN